MTSTATVATWVIDAKRTRIENKTFVLTQSAFINIDTGTIDLMISLITVQFDTSSVGIVPRCHFATIRTDAFVIGHQIRASSSD